MKFLKNWPIKASGYFVVVGGALLFACPSSALDATSVKAQVIAQTSAKFGMDPHDLQQQKLTVTPVQQNNGETAYHVVGQFTLGWLQPRNPGEVAQIYANKNRCTFVGVNCQSGLHHTIYLDITAAQTKSSATLSISGDESLDQTIEERQQQDVGDLSPDNPHLSAAVEAANPKNCKPVIISRATPSPVYPPQAIRQRHEGTVILQIFLNSNGSMRDVRVYKSSGYHELDMAAIEVTSRWQHSSIVCAGTKEPAVAVIRVPITFGLHGKSPLVAPPQ